MSWYFAEIFHWKHQNSNILTILKVDLSLLSLYPGWICKYWDVAYVIECLGLHGGASPQSSCIKSITIKQLLRAVFENAFDCFEMLCRNPNMCEQCTNRDIRFLEISNLKIDHDYYWLNFLKGFLTESLRLLCFKPETNGERRCCCYATFQTIFSSFLQVHNAFR